MFFCNAEVVKDKHNKYFGERNGDKIKDAFDGYDLPQWFSANQGSVCEGVNHIERESEQKCLNQQFIMDIPGIDILGKDIFYK